MISLPDLGEFPDNAGLVELPQTGDGRFVAGENGVCVVAATADRKVEFVGFAGHTLARVTSALGYPAYYPVQPLHMARPVKAVLMDLDGTSVHSEGFWVWIIELTTATLLGQPGFALEQADLPFVSGHSVSEHLQYCLDKYCPQHTLEQARLVYYEHTRREMRAILEGRGRVDAFAPAPGLKEFLLALKARRVKIGLVTSGLHEKAYPEIVAAFRQMDMGDPRRFYDAFISAGFPLRAGEPGTLGELSPKPHPWLYAETARVGLGVPFSERGHVVGIEDSAAGVCAIRLAGFAAIGVSGGNIVQGGARSLCTHYVGSLHEALAVLNLGG